jgi:hypothetical protein
MESRSRSAACAALVTGMLVGMPPAIAGELSYGAYVGMGHTDNIERVNDDKQAESIASIGAQLSLEHESRRLTTSITSRLEYRDYLDNTFDSEVIGNLVGNALFDIVEERLTWTIEDTFGQSTVNQFAPVTPGNRENVNYLSTGPDLTLPFLSRNKLVIRGRLADVNYESSNLGNQRIRGELALQRDLSEASNASINATSEQVDFEDDTQFIDYDRNEGFLNYSANSARTNLSIDGGITEIRSQGEKQDTWLGRIAFTRHVSSAATLTFEVGHDFSDAGTIFVELESLLQPGSTDPVPVQQTATPFENTYGLLRGEFSGRRTEVRLQAGYNDEKYQDQSTFDRTRLTLLLTLERDLSSVISAHVGGNYSRQDYDTLGRTFADMTATLGMRWNFGRASYVSLDYQYLDRSDDLSTAEYSANEVWLRVAYLVGEGVTGGKTSGSP